MSPNQLIPSQPYTLSYYITDHTDNGTYYVQAVIYDAATGEVLDTQNLTRQTTNTHLFSKVAQAPGDSSGHGRRIVVVATAYDDAGHTTKSTNYAQQSENYIVAKAGVGLTLGGGGIDYQMISDIFTAELEKITKGTDKAWASMVDIVSAIADRLEKIPTDKVELAPIVKILTSLESAISKIPTKPTDLTKAHDLIEQVLGSVHAMMNDKASGEDKTAITDAIAELKNTLATNHDDSKNLLNTHMSDLHTVLPKTIEDGVGRVINPKPVEPVAEKPAEPVKTEPVDNQIDISKLIDKPTE